MTEEFSGQKIDLSGDVRVQGLKLELQPYESKIFTFRI